MPVSGAQALLTLLADAGVTHLFGNPGTTELPLMDALVDQSRIRYILGLQEVPVMAMADGFAQASRKIGVVNLHIGCGLGNAMGMLYNAWREGTPLLVTAGQQDRRLQYEDPVLAANLVEVARPWTKWATEVDRLQDLPRAVRRAVQTALTPPRGPVFLSVPMDVQLELAELDLRPAATLDYRTRPPEAALVQAAYMLFAAKCPGILVGSRVQEADAVDELVAVADLLGAPVMSECATSHGRLGFPADHPLSAPGLPLWAPSVRERLQGFDVLLVVGMELLRQYLYHEGRPIPEPIKLLHLDDHASALGKNYALDLGIWGDIKTGLAGLAAQLQRPFTPSMTANAGVRRQVWQADHERQRRQLHEQVSAERNERPMTPLTLMESLARVLPTNVAVIEEAVTTTGTYFERSAALRNTDGYFGHRGWALGWGLGCALGVKLAWPTRPVLCLLGEGAAMYGIQGLWTAAHDRIPVTFVICNNRHYQILKDGAKLLGLPNAVAGRHVGHDLLGPEIDFVALAQSMGVPAEVVTEPEALSSKVAASLASDEPRLFNVPIQGAG